MKELSQMYVFLRKWYSAAQKVKAQYRIFETVPDSIIYVFKIRFTCVQSIMYVMSATLVTVELQFFIKISSVHEAFSLSSNVHVENIGT